MTKPLNGTELRAYVARSLKRSALPRGLWRELGSFRESYLRTRHPEELKGVLVEARRLLRIHRLGAGMRLVPGRPRESQDLESLLPQHDVQRAQAFSAHLGRRAALAMETRLFRALHQRRGTTSDSEAERLVSSPAAQVFPREWFKRAGIPIAAHESHLVDRRPSGPGGRMLEARPISPSPTMCIRIRWGSRTKRIRFGLEHYFHLTERGRDQLAVPTPFRQPRLVPVETGSVLDELRRAAVALARKYPWSEADAGWFVMTGKVPLVPAMRVDFEDGAVRLPLDHRHLRVRLSVQPWVSGATVRRIYEHFRRAVYKRGSRPLGPRGITLFGFVEGRRSKRGQLPSWRAMLVEWNRSYPEWGYGFDARRFCRDYARVVPALLLPQYTFPPEPPVEPARRGSARRRSKTAKRSHN